MRPAAASAGACGIGCERGTGSRPSTRGGTKWRGAAWHGKLSAADAQLGREAAKHAGSLESVLWRLSPTAIAAVTAERSEGGLELPARPDRLATFLKARLAVSSLGSAFAPFREVQAARGRHGEPHKRAVEDLAWIYQDVTGAPPKRRTHCVTHQRYGPFTDLVDRMVPLLWPEVGGCNGLIEVVCREFAKKASE